MWGRRGGYGWKIMVYQGDELLGEKVDYNRSRKWIHNLASQMEGI